MTKSPKISIITVCYNSEAYIESAINSVFNQTYKNIEYIIIDGKSTDSTLKIISKYDNKIAIVISEDDNGLYDAMNKGIALATGDIIGLINSDDIFHNNLVLENIALEFSASTIDAIYGDILYVSAQDTNKIIRYWKSRPFKKGAFQNGWHPPHPTLYLKRSVYKRFGVFNLSYKIASDFELMLRFFEKHSIKSLYLPQIFVRMRVGGTSNKNIKNILIGNLECFRAFRENSIKKSFFYLIFRLAPKLLHFSAKPKKTQSLVK